MIIVVITKVEYVGLLRIVNKFSNWKVPSLYIESHAGRGLKESQQGVIFESLRANNRERE
jgi:hypothetical protein